MTKDNLIENVKSRIYTKGTLSASSVIELIEQLYAENAVIPKGENRHPYADVLHEWIEGAEVEYNTAVKDIHPWRKLSLPERGYSHTYRIKPSEPVYEWQWVYQHQDMDFFKTLVTNGTKPKAYFSSEEEARIYTNAEKVWKLEQTKRERKNA